MIGHVRPSRQLKSRWHAGHGISELEVFRVGIKATAPLLLAISGNGRPGNLGILGSNSALLRARPVQIGARRLLSTATIKPLRYRLIDRRMCGVRNSTG